MARVQNHAGSVSSIYSATLLRGLSEFGAATATAVARYNRYLIANKNTQSFHYFLRAENWTYNLFLDRLWEGEDSILRYGSDHTHFVNLTPPSCQSVVYNKSIFESTITTEVSLL